MLVLAGCGSKHTTKAAAEKATPACPAAWRAGWQALANRIHAPVYCPTWMPDPLDAQMGGRYGNGRSVSRDRSYLVSFFWGEPGSGEVHVNFPHAGDIAARIYTANQGADQWHVLYAWKREGSLYTISEHVAPPYGYSGVVRNLKRMLNGLVLIRPES